MKARVHTAGFQDFMTVISVVQRSTSVLRALAERWWATTNTFHFGFGEMTVTPLDFSMLTGLRCGGEPIPWYRDIQRAPEVISCYLGMPAAECAMLPGCISCSALREYYRHYDYSTPETRDILARAFILYMLGTSLFSSIDNTVSLGSWRLWWTSRAFPVMIGEVLV